MSRCIGVLSFPFKVEVPDDWLKYGNPWEKERPEYTVPVYFYGKAVCDDEGFNYEWVDAEEVHAVAHDIPVAGFENKVVNTIRLWSAKSPKAFDLSYCKLTFFATQFKWADQAFFISCLWNGFGV